jgi:hypothetical protein
MRPPPTGCKDEPNIVYMHSQLGTFLDTLLTNIIYLVLHWVVKTNSLFPLLQITLP